MPQASVHRYSAANSANLANVLAREREKGPAVKIMNKKKAVIDVLLMIFGREKGPPRPSKTFGFNFRL